MVSTRILPVVSIAEIIVIDTMKQNESEVGNDIIRVHGFSLFYTLNIVGSMSISKTSTNDFNILHLHNHNMLLPTSVTTII